MTKKKAPLKKSVIQGAQRRARLIKAVTKISEMDVEFISILTDGVQPANGCPVLIKSVDGNKTKAELKLHVLKKDVKEGKLYATSMEPGKKDKQGDVAEAKDIEKMAHSILEKGVGIDVNHELKKTDTKIVESFIKRGTDPMFVGEDGKEVAVGSHCLVFKLGKSLLDKDITGISVYGTTKREELEKDDTQTAPPGIGPSLKAMRIKAGIGDIQVATALGLDHQQYSDLESDTADIELTADQLKAVGKILKIDPLELAAELLGGAAADENAEDEPPVDGAGDTPPDPNKKPDDSTTLGKSQKMDKEKITKEKKLLKSATIIVKDDLEKSDKDNGETSGESSLLNKEWKPSTEDVKKLRKSILGFSDEGRERLQKGDIVSTDFAPGGNLAPEVGRTLLSLVRDQSQILRKINLYEVKRRDAEVLVNNFTATLSRQAVGPHGSGDAQGVINLSKKVSTEEVDLLVRIPNRTIDEFRDDLPQLEQTILGMVQTGFANKITKLLFMGSGGVYNPADDMTLNSGIFKLMDDGEVATNCDAIPAAQVLDLSVAGINTANVMEVMDAMRLKFITELPEFDDPTIPFFMGATDFYNFGLEMKQNLMGLQLQINGVEPKYDSHPIEVVNQISTTNYLLTPLANIGLAILNSASVDGGIKVQVTPIRKGVEWLFTMQIDPFFASKIAIRAKA